MCVRVCTSDKFTSTLSHLSTNSRKRKTGQKEGKNGRNTEGQPVPTIVQIPCNGGTESGVW